MSFANIEYYKENAKIADTVGQYVELRRKGAGLVGICPFHEDKRPSLMVSPAKNICKCFACGEKAMDAVNFIMKIEKTDFKTAVRKAAIYSGIYKGEGFAVPKRITPIRKKETLPLLLNRELPERYLNWDGNPLINWLYNLPWPEAKIADVGKWLEAYKVGTSRHGETKGWTIWWQINELGFVFTGKMMRYGMDGRRVKGYGYNVNYVHKILEKEERLDLIGKEVRSCLFGMHLLAKVKPQTVAIVESEKSALIAQVFNADPTRLFMATGGKERLNRNMVQPLISRGLNIILYPDIDAVEEWTEFTKKTSYSRMAVSKNIMDMYDAEKDGVKADIADILIRRLIERNEKENV